MRSRGGSDTETEESSGHCEDVSTLKVMFCKHYTTMQGILQ